MKHLLSNNTLSRVSLYIVDNLALHFPKERWDDLERNMLSASGELGYKNLEMFSEYIMSSKLTHENVEIMTAYFTNNETYFWREPETFKALEQIILPGLIMEREKEKRIRIWSAGCSTGEEPYSIAIAIQRLIPDLADWNISILATDISPRILQKAKNGTYSQWSFRNSPHWLKDKYFLKQENNKFGIIPEIKNMVKFEYLNLAEDIFASPVNGTNGMDIIFCRNVLMYFSQERVNKTICGFRNSLIDNGHLVVSASELSLLNFHAFNPVYFPGIVLYQKTSAKLKNQFLIPVMEIRQETVEFQIPFEYFNNRENKIPTVFQIVTQPIPEPVCPPHVNSIYENALNSYSAGKYQDVIDFLEKDDQTLEEQKLLIRAYANLGKLTEALKSCEKAITCDRIDPYLHYLYAIILQESNQLDESIDSLKRTIYLDSNFALSHYTLGNIYNRLGNIKRTKKCYENVLSILNNRSQDEILPESDGLTAGRLLEIVNASIKSVIYL